MKLTDLNESATADMKNLARAAAKKSINRDEPEKNPHPSDSFQHRVWQEAFDKEMHRLEKAESKSRD